ncbi:bifunctional diguanylate cyclase/phosphodiesterase [Pantoea eucalypti]|jgi:diguanylate cyclase (GGDEF)-like protein/PAS domain S-box-containing protein|uniref:bifunctional diguanylate cyclase/phosphodiesterase n=1 Tax=Pantoea eucalypti TaxID=470933 RepID=UPI0024B90692|nr:EAL domain-containing protein [Pantoea eucalypti]MDJ0472545.1 EAL domain-containing protein [Pantoea eucalypti]
MTFNPPAPPALPFRHVAEDRTVRFTRRSLRVLSLLLFGVLALSMLMVLTIAQRQNSVSVEHDRLLMQQAWKSRQEAMVTDIRDYAFWGEAWQNLHVSVDKVWAFDEENFGPGLYEEYHYEGVFVVDGKGHTRYSVINGKLVDTPLEAWLGKETSAFIAAARQLNNKAMHRDVLINHLPAIVVAAPITSGKVRAVTPVAGPPSIMIFVSLFTPEKLKALGTSLDVRELRAPASEEDALREPRMMLTLPMGDPIVLRWTSKMPGMGLIWFLLPLLMLMAIIIAIITRRVSRHALSNAIISDRRFAMLAISQQDLANSEARFRDLAEAASDWIWETDAEGRLIYLSARFHTVTGHDITHWLGRHIDHLLTHPSHSLVAWLRRQEEDGQQMPLRCQFMSAHGNRRIGQLVAKTIWHDAKRIGFRGTVSDITQGMEAEARIQFLSRHDVLTGLSNRMQLLEFLTLHLAITDGSAPLTLVTLDLDQFRPINETWGHAAGDEVLSQIAQRLKRCIGPQELVARLSGDEFVLVLREANRERVDQRCAQLVHEVQQPISTGQHVHYLTISMGIACAPQDASHPEALLEMADIALNEARDAGRNQWVWYANEMTSQREDKREMARRIEKALKNNEFRLHYQPRYQLLTGQLAGAEALIRWQIAPDQWITPEHFIPLAEESGLIATISDWVLMRACEDALGWGGERYVSVNISPMEFRTSDLVQRVANALEKSGLPATRLELEITENVTFEHPQHALEIMQGLRSLGVRLTVDDFGTGYAALGYLKTFPFNGLKIDRSWMKDFPESQQAQSVVAGIIALARAFALTITAEGIETEAQLNQLKQLSCEEGQGYFLGRPMPLAAFRTLLERTAQNQPEMA